MAHGRTPRFSAGRRAVNVTVVIATHNMAETLGEAVDSALVAGATDVVIFDDRSTDDTWQAYLNITARHGKLVRRVAGLELPVKPAVGRNIAIQHCDYNLILPLDADDQLLPDGLKALRSAYRPGAVVYGGWIENGQAVRPPPPGMLRRKHVCHATYLFHKNDWLKVRGYDPDFSFGGEDWAFLVALQAAGLEVVCVDAPIYARGGVNGRTQAARARGQVIKDMIAAKWLANG